MLACDIEEYGEGDSSREDLEEQWSEIDLSRDAWVAIDDRAENDRICLVLKAKMARYW